jgi:Uma2 family endonuclease
LRWTSKDLELLPDDGKRYEIIDGELHAAKQLDVYHQQICLDLGAALRAWDRQTGTGYTSLSAGVIFADDENVAPDVIWMPKSRFLTAVDARGHIQAAPDLVVEVLSPGEHNERRDREAKLKLYSRRGVLEYWIVDWRLRQVEVFRRAGIGLDLVGTLRESDTLTSPHLTGFSHPLETLFADVPRL